jgi:peptidoglycan/LPS O-acetylase OafA/YrhL
MWVPSPLVIVAGLVVIVMLAGLQWYLTEQAIEFARRRRQATGSPSPHGTGDVRKAA